jgi:hypothetical protein
MALASRGAGKMASALSTQAPREITTLIFDIDDTLYPVRLAPRTRRGARCQTQVSSRFSDHRNGAIVADFMVDALGFASQEAALKVRDEYFRKYHSTLKGLSVATSEGKLPKPFEEHMLGEYWAKHCEFEKFLPPNLALAQQLKSLRDDAGLRLVVFTNVSLDKREPSQWLECARALATRLPPRRRRARAFEWHRVGAAVVRPPVPRRSGGARVFQRRRHFCRGGRHARLQTGRGRL